VEIQPTGIAPDVVALAAQQLPQRHSDRFGEEIPDCLLQRFLEWDGKATDISAARAVDAMRDRSRRLVLQTRPDLFAKHSGKFRLGSERMEQALYETEPDCTLLADQLERREVNFVRPHLAIADDSIAPELETRDPEVDYPHFHHYNLVVSQELKYQLYF
jgi:hypothetical protein